MSEAPEHSALRRAMRSQLVKAEAEMALVDTMPRAPADSGGIRQTAHHSSNILGAPTHARSYPQAYQAYSGVYTHQPQVAPAQGIHPSAPSIGAFAHPQPNPPVHAQAYPPAPEGQGTWDTDAHASDAANTTSRAKKRGTAPSRAQSNKLGRSEPPKGTTSSSSTGQTKAGTEDISASPPAESVAIFGGEEVCGLIKSNAACTDA